MRLLLNLHTEANAFTLDLHVDHVEANAFIPGFARGGKRVESKIIRTGLETDHVLHTFCAKAHAWKSRNTSRC